LLAAENVAAATRRIQEINAVLRKGMPRYEALLSERAESAGRATAILDASCLEVRRHTATHLTNTALHLPDAAAKVAYPGLLSLWDYAENVLLAIVRHLEHEVAECDRFASFTIYQARAQLDALERQRRCLDAADPHSPTPECADDADGDAAAAGADNSSNVSASQLASVGSISNALDTVQLELADFVDLNFAHNWAALTSISASASLSLLATRSMSSNVLGLLRLSSTVGAATGRRLMVAAAALVGVGSVFYFVSDMDATVRRKLSARVALLLGEEGFVDHHAERLATETTRAVRPFVWHLQHTFQRMVEAEEHRRADHLRLRRSAQDSQIYFDELRIKGRDLAAAVRAVSSGTMC
ncbi:mitofusin, partial [Coemansia spiralis]